jgi:murein DD-endopeptidase MepM/ murein hydrolase activator NlpD
MLKFQFRLLALVLTTCVAGAPALAQKEFYQVRITDPALKNTFRYYELGKHVPKRSGRRPYPMARFVVAPNIGLPMDIDPLRGEQMYCNTQVYGLGGFHRPRTGNVPSGSVNSSKNYFFPWTSNMCEKRGRSGADSYCGTGLKEHQGQDCRPPKPTSSPKYFVTAVDDGKVTWKKAAQIGGVTISNKDFRWTYLHMVGINVNHNQRVSKGRRLGKVWSLGSGAIHLHITVRFRDKDGFKRYDPLPSLIVAYRKALGKPAQIDHQGNLAFDSRFEIAHDPAKRLCGEAEQRRSLGTEKIFNFESLWCHNGSIVGLEEDGADRRLIYYKTKDDFAEAAVKAAPVVFDGLAFGDGNGWNGRAHHHSLRCGDRVFDVEGDTLANGQKIRLAGQREAFADPQSCTPTKVDEVLEFTFLRKFGVSAPPPVQPPKPKDETEQISLWNFYGSKMRLLADDAARRLVFYEPTGPLADRVNKGDTLFVGTKRGSKYFGDLTLFYANPACQPGPVRVVGNITDNSRRIVFSGTRKVILRDCSEDGTVRFRRRINFVEKRTVDGQGNAVVVEETPKPSVGSVDRFELPEPDLNGAGRLTLWSTHYYVFRGVHRNGAVPLRSKKNNRSLGASLARSPWCKAAVEGTVIVSKRLYNYTGTRSPDDARCQSLFQGGGVNWSSVSKSRWKKLDSKTPFGLGNKAGIRLVPFRSIATDQKRPGLSARSVVYIPSLRGKTFTNHDGVSYRHDGYVFVADTGGAIKGNHIDFFSGIQAKNPFPGLIKSSRSGTFKAFVISGRKYRAIREALAKLHRPQ